MRDKQCRTCEEVKDIDDFNRVAAMGPDYRDPVCKECRLANVRADAKIRPFVHSARRFKKRAILKDVPFDLDAQYLEDIWTGVCPIFKTKLILPFHSTPNAAPSKYVSSLDRIIPERGYTKGNVEWVSTLANTIKQSATAEELQAVADHVHLREKEIKQHEAD